MNLHAATGRWAYSHLTQLPREILDILAEAGLLWSKRRAARLALATSGSFSANPLAYVPTPRAMIAHGSSILGPFR